MAEVIAEKLVTSNVTSVYSRYGVIRKGLGFEGRSQD